MNFVKWLICFLLINFGGLALGSWLMNNGPKTAWYLSLNKAPWTPPGWVFGAAWTLIMICFSIYLAYLFTEIPSLKLKIVFVCQVVLNVIWNYLFFNLHQVAVALVCILGLTGVIFYFFFSFKTPAKAVKLLLLPYMIWLIIASSLNAYVLIYN